MLKYIHSIALDKKDDFLSNCAKPLLFLISLCYALFIRAVRYRKLKKKQKFPCKVISVGNIVLGGTGKTPLVECIAYFLKQQNKNLAIVKRSYTLIRQDLTDEANMLKQKLNLPVIIDNNRLKAIKEAIKIYNADTVILDDGFQQWQIKKDLEILAIDTRNPFGNKRLIPRGILREPLDGLKRADIVVLTKVNLGHNISDLKTFIYSVNRDVLISEAEYIPEGVYNIKEKKLIEPSFLKGKRAIIFSGIADPGSFRDIVLNLGVEIEEELRFPDHHLYSSKDINRLKSIAWAKGVDIFITTEKDAVKLSRFEFPTIEIFVLRIKISIRDEEIFFKRLLSIYSY